MKRILYSLLLMVSVACGTASLIPAQAQEGQWKIHHSYASYSCIESFHGYCYMISSGNVCYYDLQSGEVGEMNRLTGLAGSNVQYMGVSPDADVLILVYSDGNIDIMDADRNIYNLSDLKNKSMTGSRMLRGLQIQGTSAYISGDFGFVEVDLLNRTILYSCTFIKPCRKVFTYGGYIYALTTTDTRRCSLSKNIIAPANWELCGLGMLQDVVVFESQGAVHCWIADETSRIWEINENGEPTQFCGWTYKFHDTPSYLLARAERLLFYDKKKGIWFYTKTEPYASAADVTVAQDSLLCVVDALHSLTIAPIPTDVVPEQYIEMQAIVSDLGANDLLCSELYALTIHENKVYGVYSTGSYSNLGEMRGVVSSWDGSNWSSFTHEDPIQGQGVTKAFKGLVSIAIHPSKEDCYYVGTHRQGLYCIDHDTIAAYYDHTNSIIENYGSDSYVCDNVSSLSFDDNGYLWMSNSAVPNILKSMSPTGEWRSYPIKGFENTSFVVRLLLARHDPYKFKWLLSGMVGYQKGKCAIYYDAGTPDDLSDDESTVFTSLTDQDDNVIIPSYFNDIAEDNNGAIWLLTTSGPFVIDSQIDAYNNPGRVRRVKVPRNDGTNLADYLLDNVNCKCMVVDAANRKWIGTDDNGLFLLSADGLEMLQHFTTENSPLPSNSILSLAIDNQTGELYISASGGLYSYRSDAIAAFDNYNDFKCYPNPVGPEYTGDLHISGLKDHSLVRITDIRNHVIYSAESTSGMITWDLKNASGHRVKSGVYLVYCVEADGSASKVGKFLVVN